MKKVKSKIIIIIAIILACFILGALYYFVNFYIKTIEKEQNITKEFSFLENRASLQKNLNKGNNINPFTEVPVQKVGAEYFIDISKGNESYCIWRYHAGNGNIPYIEVTQANTINEKHNIKLGDAFWDFSVYCFDDWGNNYKGLLNK